MKPQTQQNKPSQLPINEEAIKQRIDHTVEQAEERHDQEVRLIMKDSSASIAELNTEIQKMKEHHSKLVTNVIVWSCLAFVGWITTIMLLA